MRGKVSSMCISDSASRITPAYAGKRLVPCPSPSAFWDHPRLCGEKCHGRGRGDSIGGSPPPMRGKDVVTTVVAAPDRITPAYAGKRFPHQVLLTVRQGSPPPMRGKVQLTMFALCAIRITPAYAGKSYTLLQVFWCCWDHPRLCGEKRQWQTAKQTAVGSPPPMRGKD